MLSTITRLGLQGQILAGFAAILALAVTVSIVGYRAVTTVKSDLVDHAELGDNTVNAAIFNQQFTELRRLLRVYLEGRSPAVQAEVTRLKAQLATEIQRLEAAATNDAARRTLGEVAQQFHQYRQNFDVALDAIAREDAIRRDRLDPTGVRMHAAFRQLLIAAEATGDARAVAMIAGLRADVQTLRLQALRAINEAADPAAIDPEAAQLLQSLNDAQRTSTDAQLSQLLADLDRHVQVYVTAFRDAASARRVVEDIVNGTNARLAETIASRIATLSRDRISRLEENRREAEDAADSARVTLGAVGTATIVAGVVLALGIGAAIAKPVRGMTRAMTDLAAGELQTSIPSQARRDELGRMAAAVQVFKDSMIETERLRAEQEAARVAAAAERRAGMLALADSFETTVGGIVRGVAAAATQMQSSAEMLQTTAGHTSKESAAVATAAEQTSANVQTVAAAVEEMNASISEIGLQMSNATARAEDASRAALDTDSHVQALADNAVRIGEVVKLISAIAAQTNLLALNATIEAARAGDAGRGFAVVASEVKSLASQTAQATSDITARVTAMQAATSETVHAIRAIIERIGEISQASSAIASAVEQQSASTQEIAKNVQQAAVGTEDVTTTIGRVAAAATQTGGASSELRSAADDLSRQSEVLRGEVDRFLADVRAA